MVETACAVYTLLLLSPFKAEISSGISPNMHDNGRIIYTFPLFSSVVGALQSYTKQLSLNSQILPSLNK